MSSVVPNGGDDVTFGSVAYSFLGVTMTGPHAVNSITFDTPTAFTISNSGGLTTALTLVSGGLTQTANDTGSQTISVPVALGNVATWALNGTGTIIVSQPISSGGQVLGLTISGTGNLTLQGQNSYQGDTLISGSGTVLLTGSIGSAIGGADPSNLIINSQQGANFNLATTATDTSTLITNETAVGYASTGTFTQNGGSHITKQLSVGFSSGGNGTYNLINGSVTTTTHSTIVGGDSSGDTLANGSQGVFNQSGGVHQTPQLEIGSSPGSAGTYNLSSGVLSVSQATFVGEADEASGLFNQTGGQNTTQALVLGISIQQNTDPIIPGGWNRVRNVSDLNGVLQHSALSDQAAVQPAVQTGNPIPVTAKYVLSGGTLTTEAIEGISPGSGTEFDFDGGTLKPTVNLNTFISGLDAAVVQVRGAIIDTNGFNVTVPQALSHDASLGTKPDGGLEKTGDGILQLTGSVTYTGVTYVNAGTLFFPATSGTFATAGFKAFPGAALNLNGGTLGSSGIILDQGSVEVTHFENDGTINIAGGTNAATFFGDATTLVLAAGSHTNVGSAAVPGGSLTLQNGATVQLNGTLVNNGTITGEVDINSGAVLSGNGRVDTVSAIFAGILHPGNGPGTMHASTVTLGAKSVLQFDINSATGSPGTNWSLLQVDGLLTLGGVQPSNANVLKLVSVSGQGDTETPLTDFDPSQPYSWQFATFGSVTFNDNQPFQIDASEFANATNGGTFTTELSDGSLLIDFTPAPEPTSASVQLLASFTCLRRRRGRRKKGHYGSVENLQI